MPGRSVGVAEVVYDLDRHILTVTPNRAQGLPGGLSTVIYPALGGTPR